MGSQGLFISACGVKLLESQRKEEIPQEFQHPAAPSPPILTDSWPQWGLGIAATPCPSLRAQ